jgi:CPA1 family monovalent cation:H+ antiporter
VRYVLAGLAAIMVVLVARFISESAPGLLIRGTVILRDGSVAILTWGAVPGGLSVAMALSIPAASAGSRWGAT